MTIYRDQLMNAIDKALNQYDDTGIDKFGYSSTPDHVETVVNHIAIDMMATIKRNTYADRYVPDNMITQCEECDNIMQACDGDHEFCDRHKIVVSGTDRICLEEYQDRTE